MITTYQPCCWNCGKYLLLTGEDPLIVFPTDAVVYKHQCPWCLYMNTVQPFKPVRSYATYSVLPREVDSPTAKCRCVYPDKCFCSKPGTP